MAVEKESLVLPLHHKKTCDVWCVEMQFPVMGAVEMYTSLYLYIIFGELLSYHGVIIMPILLFLTGMLNSIAGCLVNYERFKNKKQSRTFMTCVAFISISNALICLYYYQIYISKEMSLKNMQAYLDNQFVKTMIDLTQQTFECCGDCNFTDWFSVDWRGTDIEPGRGYPPNGRKAVPFSCCSPEASSPCTNEYIGLDNRITLYRQGCHEALTSKLQLLALIEATVLFITGLLQVYWLLNVRPRVGQVYDVEKGDDDVADGDDGIGKPIETPQDTVVVEVPSDVEQDENTDSDLPEIFQEASCVIPIPIVPSTEYPVPDSCNCLIATEEIAKTEPSLNDDEVKNATDGIEEASSCDEPDRAIDAELDALTSQEDPLESGGENTDDSSAEWLRTQLVKDLSASEANDEEACECEEEGNVLEEKEDINTGVEEPSAESDGAAVDNANSTLP